MRHFLTLFDLSPEEISHLLKDAEKLKKAHQRGKTKPILQGKVLGMVFEKPSLRTRVSFQAVMAQLGGGSVFLTGAEVGLGSRESQPDIARTLGQFVDSIVLRVFRHETVELFAAHAGCPVINGLSDRSHPCQALGDLLTMRELFGDLKGKTVAFIGDGNNVARSLAVGCGKLGPRFILASPAGYGFDAAFLDRFRQEMPDAQLELVGDPRRAVKEADIIYTDVWTSMGQEAERDQRQQHFKGYQINEELLALAPEQARVMHCLPAHRGEEITAGVIDGDRSVVFEQAGNRMHAQKALLKWLLG
jgi:ornithine carbamoyltransferase